MSQATRGDLWLSVPEVAQLLRVQNDTVRRWIRGGLIPALELGGPRSGYRIRREDLDHFLWQRFRMRSQEDRDLAIRDEYANLAAESTHLRVMPVAEIPMDVPLHTDGRRATGDRPGEQDLDPQEFVQYPLMSYHRSPEHVLATIDFVSPYIEEISGHSAAEFRASATLWRELLHPADRQRILALRRRQIESNERFALEYRLRGVDGQIIWVREEAVPNAPESDQQSPWDGIVLNIDERKRVEQALQSRLRQQDVVAQLSRRALETSDLQLLFDEAVLFVHDTLRVDYSKILELQPGGDHFLIIAGVGWPEGFVGQATVSSAGYSQAGYTLLSSAPIVVDDLRRETRFSGPSVLFEHNVISSLTVIIPGHEKAWGVLGAHSLHYRPFSIGDVYFLQSVAHAIANAIQLHRNEGQETQQQWLTVTEVADQLQVTEETVRRWIRSNQLPVVELGSRRAGYRIHPSDLDQFLRDRYHGRAADAGG